MNKTQKMIFENSFGKSITVMLEPWGEDYTLREDETVKIIAENCGQEFYFYIIYEKDWIGIWANGKNNEYPRIYSQKKELECGYNRDLS